MPRRNCVEIAGQPGEQPRHDERPSRQLVLDLPHRTALGRDDFLVTPSNAAAVAMIDRYPDWPHYGVVLVGGGGQRQVASAGSVAAGVGRAARVGRRRSAPSRRTSCWSAAPSPSTMRRATRSTSARCSTS